MQTYAQWFAKKKWGRVDSNHRTHPRTDLQSVAIATMRLPLGIKSYLKELLDYAKNGCKDTLFFIVCKNYEVFFSERAYLRRNTIVFQKKSMAVWIRL